MNAILRATGALAALLMLAALAACDRPPSSNDIQREQQEKLLAEGTAETGMPAIKNFRERKLMKDILELRDQDGLVTYTYQENLIPTVVKGSTALGGKLSFFCDSIGYPIPYATQYTAPVAVQRYRLPAEANTSTTYGSEILPQADPNGLFSPASADGTWILCKDPNSTKLGATYSEPKLVTVPFKFNPD